MLDFNIALKEPFPYIQSDAALYAETLCTLLPRSAPAYLSDYCRDLRRLAKKRTSLNGNSLSDIPRVYIFDNRMNPLFVGLDESGAWSSDMYNHARCNHFESDYVFGDGSSIDDQGTALQEFVKDLGFIPIENFALSALVIYQGDSFIGELLSVREVVTLLKAFADHNLLQ